MVDIEWLYHIEYFYDCFYEETKNTEWFSRITQACEKLETKQSTIDGIIGVIHELVEEDLESGMNYFWTIFLVNPLIAIKAYQESDLLFGKIDLSETFKAITYKMGGVTSGIYNNSYRNFYIYAIEALLQKEVNPEMMNHIFLRYMDDIYQHDKKIMYSNLKKKESKSSYKWMDKYTMNHILAAADPHHIILILKYFAKKYNRRLRVGPADYSYSGRLYKQIIQFIEERYGCLSEYIEWDTKYIHHYVQYFEISLPFDELYDNLSVVFASKNDWDRIKASANLSSEHYHRMRKLRLQNREISKNESE